MLVAQTVSGRQKSQADYVNMLLLALVTDKGLKDEEKVKNESYLYQNFKHNIILYLGFIKSNQLCAGISSGYPSMPMLYCACVWSTRG